MALRLFLLFGVVFFSTQAEALNQQETPSIFKESQCLGSISLPGKPTPLSSNPVIGDFIPPGILSPCLPHLSCQVSVNSGSQLQSALNSSACGCEIIASGTISGTIKASKICTISNPIIVRSATPQSATLRSPVEITGSGIYFSGFTVSGGHFDIYKGSNNVIMGNLFTTKGDISVGGGGADGNQIIYNKFDHTMSSAPTTGMSETRVTDANIVFNLRPNENPQNQNNVVAFNHFDSGNVYSIWVGTYDLESRFGYIYKAQTLISNNLWTNWAGKHAIEIKSHSNIVQYNTVLGGQALVLNRNGSYSKFIANWFEDSVGLNLYDNNHLVLGNKVVGRSKINLFGDGYVSTAERAAEGKGLRKGADFTQAIGNDGAIVLGGATGELKNSKAVEGVCLQANTGPIIQGEYGSSGLKNTCGWTGASPEAHKLSPGEVGLIRFAGGNTPGCTAGISPGSGVDPIGTEPEPGDGDFDDLTWVAQHAVSDTTGAVTVSGNTAGFAPGTTTDNTKSLAIWSSEQISDNWKVTFTYTRQDDQPVSDGGTFMAMYFFKGTGSMPSNISEWSNLASLSDDPPGPYGTNAAGFRFSFDTSGSTSQPTIKDHIGMRKHPGHTKLPPDGDDHFTFPKNVAVNMTVTRIDGKVTLVAQIPGGASKTVVWQGDPVYAMPTGNIGFRSGGRFGTLGNITITQLP